MSRRRSRRRSGNSLGSVVDDSAHIAAQFGPLGAMTTGAIGFVIFYVALPFGAMAWSDSEKAKLIGPMGTVFARLLDQVVWQRLIGPSQWAGAAILLVCWVIAAWKCFSTVAIRDDELAGASWAAKLLARLLQ